MPSYCVEHITIKPLPALATRVLLWSTAWFALINIAVWWVCDVQFFSLIWQGRLLNDPSEQEITAVMEDIKREKIPHTILLGDSTIWGIELPYEDTVAAKLAGDSIINLATPGDTFYDQLAIIKYLYTPDDQYVFFINPVWFNTTHDNRDTAEVLRFPNLAAKYIDTGVPGDRGAIVATRRLMMHLVPLYRNRDSLHNMLLHMHPRRVVDVILNRLRPSDREKEPLAERTLSDDDVRDFRKIRSTQNYAELNEVLSHLKDYNNITYVILDDRIFKRTAQVEENMNILHELVASTGKTLDLHNTFRNEHFMDFTHLNAEGHSYLASRLYAFLYAN
ncbi:MAG: hypothetical protein KC680_03605 [Candidatus Peregrinibacteria bacterium]|nr:hypothetical protein [Candidatus Peregrinibacteria bacterium]MCB9808634.1 hypothetical protein [Candidatus Peribacteria bacterium]